MYISSYCNIYYSDKLIYLDDTSYTYNSLEDLYNQISYDLNTRSFTIEFWGSFFHPDCILDGPVLFDELDIVEPTEMHDLYQCMPVYLNVIVKHARKSRLHKLYRHVLVV